MSEAREALEALRRHTDSMENIQLYLMQISELMRQLSRHVQTLGEVTQDMNARISRLEEEQSFTTR